MGGGEGAPLYRLYRSVRPQRVCFLGIEVINRASILAILTINRVWVLHSGLELGMFLEETTFSALGTLSRDVFETRSAAGS